MWPDHCVQGPVGADLYRGLARERTDLLLQKGWDSDVDSYSGFFDNAGGETQLDSLLRKRGVTKVYVVGLAQDFCVGVSGPSRACGRAAC